MNDMELFEKAVRAAKAIVAGEGYEVIDAEWNNPSADAKGFAAYDGDALVFIEVFIADAADGGFRSRPVDENEFAASVGKWVVDNDAADSPVRYDVIEIMPLADNAALSRHAVSAMVGAA